MCLIYSVARRLNDMELRSTLFIFLLLFSALFATSSPGAAEEVEDGEPLEAQCRPYVEQALKKLETSETPTVEDADTSKEVDESRPSETETETEPHNEVDGLASEEQKSDEQQDEPSNGSQETETILDDQSREQTDTETPEQSQTEAEIGNEEETEELREEHDATADAGPVEESLVENKLESEESETVTQNDEISAEQTDEPAGVSEEETSMKDEDSKEDNQTTAYDNKEEEHGAQEESAEEQKEEDLITGVNEENASSEKKDEIDSKEEEKEVNSQEGVENVSSEKEEDELSGQEKSEEEKSTEDQLIQELETSKELHDDAKADEEHSEEQSEISSENTEHISGEQETSPQETSPQEDQQENSIEDKQQSEETNENELEKQNDEPQEHKEEELKDETIEESREQQDTESREQKEENSQEQEEPDLKEEQPAASTDDTEIVASKEDIDSGEKKIESGEELPEQAEILADEQKEEPISIEVDDSSKNETAEIENTEPSSNEVVAEQTETINATSETLPEEDLMQAFDIPTNLRSRSHISQLLHLDDESNEIEQAINKAADGILKDLKRIYENAIKPLETLYKYRDLSNRHFGDPEIFSKPLVLFMGPWSGGKSSIINYLLDNEYTATSLRTGAEPSPAYFNILMWGEQPEMLDGTQLAADWTFSGLQKFGQGLEERLKGLKLPNKLLEKVNIVEIPGILEVRKQVSRVFPFNDACQWFIDRADIIFLVYDPSKLDVGPETEAILDQLKGREYQTRILLNKADQVKSEELMRVQGALIWNISPLMSSAQPPVMYLTSLWSRPYEEGAPVRLLQAQERAFLRDIKSAVDKRIENKIASARRFAVRVRNHAKMVDCYLTTYYNHKSVFANRKLVADQIIEHPQDYHIYEGLSTLTNISRYDLPDPDVYRDFFRLNPLYEFQQLAATCTYFRGCPINKLDIAIAYDFPELVGKYKKTIETVSANNKKS